jgi:hypothetical protein
MQKQFNKSKQHKREKWYVNTTSLLNIIIVLGILNVVCHYLSWVSQ